MHRTATWIVGAAAVVFFLTIPATAQVDLPNAPDATEPAAVPDAPDGAPGTDGADAPVPEPDEPATPPDAPEPLHHRVKLTDGAIFVGKLETGNLIVETPYGALTVPTADVVALQPGLDHRPEQRKRIARLIRDLGAGEYKVRQDAVDELVRMGPAVRPFVEPHLNDNDAERKKLVEQILSQFDRLTSSDFGEAEASTALIAEDRVETKLFTIVGRLRVDELTVKTDYAELTLPLARVQSIEQFDTTEPKVVVKRIDVSGDYKASFNHKNTGIRLRRGDRVTIKATGKVNMSPWGSNAFSTPEGMPNYGTYMNNIYNGALIGRIGDSGEIFNIGADHSFTADKTGTLEMAIAINHSYINHSFPGEYKVTVRVDRAKQ